MNSSNRGGGTTARLKGDPKTLAGVDPRYRRRVPVSYSVAEDQGAITLTRRKKR